MSDTSIVVFVSMLGGYILAMFVCLGGPAILSGWVSHIYRCAARRRKEWQLASQVARVDAILQRDYATSLNAILGEPSIFDRVAPNTRCVDMRMHSDYLVERAKAREGEYIGSWLREDLERARRAWQALD